MNTGLTKTEQRFLKKALELRGFQVVFKPDKVVISKDRWSKEYPPEIFLQIFRGKLK